LLETSILISLTANAQVTIAYRNSPQTCGISESQSASCSKEFCQQWTKLFQVSWKHL